MMAKTTINFECPEHYDLYMTCHAHGWKNLAPFSWDDGDHVLRFAAFVSGQPVDIEVRQAADTVKALLASIAQYSAGQLREKMPVGYRSAYLRPLAQTFSTDPTLNNIESNGFDYGTADKLVRSMKGFADYATAHLLILSGFYDEIPVDTVVVSYLKRNHRVRKPKSFINRHYRKWGKYKWWGLKLEKMILRQNWLGD